jgi:hypothetical protein
MSLFLLSGGEGRVVGISGRREEAASSSGLEGSDSGVSQNM